MDDLAPAPAQRTSDDGGRTREENFAARKKAVKKVQPAPAPKPEAEAELPPEPEADHQLDILA
jgi:hypothetical protein